MGADMLIELVSIDTGKEPDWKKGVAHIAALAATPPEKWPQEYRECYFGDDDTPDLDEHCAGLLEDLAELEGAWKGETREAASFAVGGKDVLLTGGLSWGEGPTDLFDHMSRSFRAGVSAACGFE